ncbi:MAG: ATP phosphoribosyltransferase regulatory subunit [Tissierellaceae bacterium]
MRFTTIDEELTVTKFKKAIEREIEGYFEGMGFNLIEPRIFQKYDEYVNSEHKQDSTKTVKVLSGNSRIFILRPDITINVLAEIFSKWDGEPPLKVYYNSTVYQNRPGGKILENHQMGIEYLGAEIPRGDIEALDMASNIMASIGRPYIIELGSSKYLDSYLDEMKLVGPERAELKDLIAKKNRHGLRSKLRELKIDGSILENILDMQGHMEEVIEMAKKYEMNKDMGLALEKLTKIKDYFVDKEVYENIRLDLSMVPNLDYYDGIVFKGYCLGNSTRILSGGRYDKLTEEFGLKVSAIGFMIDMDQITSIRMGEKSNG